MVEQYIGRVAHQRRGRHAPGGPSRGGSGAACCGHWSGCRTARGASQPANWRRGSACRQMRSWRSVADRSTRWRPRLERVEELRRALVEDVAHELRTPLTTPARLHRGDGRRSRRAHPGDVADGARGDRAADPAGRRRLTRWLATRRRPPASGLGEVDLGEVVRRALALARPRSRRTRDIGGQRRRRRMGCRRSSPIRTASARSSRTSCRTRAGTRATGARSGCASQSMAGACDARSRTPASHPAQMSCR